MNRLKNSLHLFAVIVAIVMPLCAGGYYALLALRHHFQVKFSEMHAMLAEDRDEGVYEDNPMDDKRFRKADNISTPLQTQANAVSWAVLKKAKLEPVAHDPDNALLPSYTPDIKKLDHESLIVQGYMFPMDSGDKQSHFLMSPYPVSCPYCYPAGATELVEIFSDTPVKFTYDPISLKGTFKILTTSEEIKDGMLYQLSGAKIVLNE